ncbi:sarcosine oxidase subunit gamma [Alsobacter sp. R-9]
MADVTMTRRSAFAGLALPGRLGAADGAPGLTVKEISGLALASVIARRGQEGALGAALSAAFGLSLPPGGKRIEGAAGTAGEGLSLVFAGPGQWLAVAERSLLAPLCGGDSLSPAAGARFADTLRQAVGQSASVIDQSDGRGVLRLSGPRARDVLAKGTGIDLHPRAFAPGDAAMTWCAHVDVTLWQRDAEPTYDLVIPRGFAGSFWHWLEESSAEYGVAVISGE